MIKIQDKNGNSLCIGAPEWISVKTALPKEKLRVLACMDGEVYISGYIPALGDLADPYWWNPEDWLIKRKCSSNVFNPTHWMELPESPKEQ